MAKDGELDLILDCNVAQAEKNIEYITDSLNKLEDRIKKLNAIGIEFKTIGLRSTEKEFKSFENEVKRTSGSIKTHAKTIIEALDNMKDANGKIKGVHNQFDVEMLKDYVSQMALLAKVIKDVRMSESASLREGEATAISDFDVQGEKEKYLSEARSKVAQPIVEDTEDFTDVWKPILDGIKEVEQAEQELTPVEPEQVVPEETVETVEERLKYTADNILSVLQEVFNKENVLGENGVFSENAFDDMTTYLRKEASELAKAASAMPEKGSGALGSGIVSLEKIIASYDTASQKVQDFDDANKKATKALEEQENKVDDILEKALKYHSAYKTARANGDREQSESALGKARSFYDEYQSEQEKLPALREKAQKTQLDLDEAEKNAAQKYDAMVVAYAKLCEAIEKYIATLQKKKEAEEKDKKDTAETKKTPEQIAENENIEKFNKTSAKAYYAIFAIKSAIKSVIGAIAQLANAFKTAVTTLARFEIAIGRGAVTAIQKCIGGIKGLINSLKQTFATMKGKLKRLLRYTLGLRGMFTLFRKLRTAIKQAIQNLVQFDKAFGDGVTSVNNSISMVKNAFLQLKNQIIAAFAPLINIVIPQYIIPMMNAVISAMQKLAMFIAYLTGAPKWIRAKKINDDYAKSLDNVGGSAKKAANNLSSLDEIHLWQDDNGGGGGGDSDKTKPEDMFEWVDTPEEMMRDPAEIARAIANIINEAIDKIPWQDIGETIAHYMNNALVFVNTLLDGIHWDKIGEGLATTVNAILSSGKWDELGEFLVQKKNVLVTMLNGFFDNLSWESLSDAITKTINSAIKNIKIEELARLLSNVIVGVIDTAGNVVANGNWDVLADKIVSGLEVMSEKADDYDWASFGEKIAEGFNKIPWSRIISSTIDTGFSLFNGIFDAILSFAENVDVKDVTKAVGSGIAKIMRAITNLLRKIDWSEVEKQLGDFFRSADFDELIKAFADLQIQILKALGATARGLVIAIPKIIFSIKDIAAEFDIDANTIKNVLFAAIGAGVAGAGLKLATVSKFTGGKGTGGLVTFGLGAVLAITMAAIEIENASGAGTGEKILTGIAGAISGIGVALAPFTGNLSLLFTLLGVVTITLTAINAVVTKANDVILGVDRFRADLQQTVQEAVDADELVVIVKTKAEAQISDVEVEYGRAREILQELLSMDFSNGPTVQSIEAVHEKMDELKSILGEENYNALGLYFDSASGSIQTTREDVRNLTTDLDTLIQKMMEQAEKEALLELWKEYRKELFRAQNTMEGLQHEQEGLNEKSNLFKEINEKFVGRAFNKGFKADAEAVKDYKEKLEAMGYTFKEGASDAELYSEIQRIAREGYKDTQQAIGDLDTEIDDYQKHCDELNTVMGGITDTLYSNEEAIVSNSEKLTFLNDAYGTTVQAIDETGNRMDLYVNSVGAVVDAEGNLVDSAYMIVDANGAVIEANKMLGVSADGLVGKHGKVVEAGAKIVDMEGKEIPNAIGARITADGKLIGSDGKVIESNAKVQKADGTYISLIEYMASITGDKASAMSEAWKRWSESSNGSVDIAQEKFSELPDALQGELDKMSGELGAAGIDMNQLMDENGVNIVKGLFMGMGKQWTDDEGELEEMWNAIGDTLCTLLGINSPSTVMSEYGGYIMQGLLEGMETEFSPITEFFNSVAEAAKSAFADIPANIASGLSGMGGRIKAPLNDAISVMNSFISKMISVANKFASTFNSIRTGINSLPNTTKLPYLMQVSGFSVSALAAGAVIPPNAPFLAMLGDQSRGRNLEAPESLIREIMREELGTASKGGSYQFVAQLNRRTLFEEMIDEAEMRQLRTGENPFML